jgi:hypothetical protein
MSQAAGTVILGLIIDLNKAALDLDAVPGRRSATCSARWTARAGPRPA